MLKNLYAFYFYNELKKLISNQGCTMMDKRVLYNNENSCKCNHWKLFQLLIKGNGNKILIV